jgi:hypothetical protein
MSPSESNFSNELPADSFLTEESLEWMLEQLRLAYAKPPVLGPVVGRPILANEESQP